MSSLKWLFPSTRGEIHFDSAGSAIGPDQRTLFGVCFNLSFLERAVIFGVDFG